MRVLHDRPRSGRQPGYDVDVHLLITATATSQVGRIIADADVKPHRVQGGSTGLKVNDLSYGHDRPQRASRPRCCLRRTRTDGHGQVSPASPCSRQDRGLPVHDSDHNVANLVSAVDVPVGLDDLGQRVAVVDDNLEPVVAEQVA